MKVPKKETQPDPFRRAEIGGVELADLNAAELDFPYGIEFTMMVQPEQYAHIIRDHSLPAVGSLPTADQDSFVPAELPPLSGASDRHRGAAAARRRHGVAEGAQGGGDREGISRQPKQFLRCVPRTRRLRSRRRRRRCRRCRRSRGCLRSSGRSCSGGAPVCGSTARARRPPRRPSSRAMLGEAVSGPPRAARINPPCAAFNGARRSRGDKSCTRVPKRAHARRKQTF
jgi:hypothetical protein